MNLESLEKFCREKGLKILSVLLDQYDSADFEVSSRDIEKEIYEASTSYAKIFFFEAKEFLQETVRSEIKSHLSGSFDSKEIHKMKDVDLVAHWIKLEIVRELEDKGLFL